MRQTFDIVMRVVNGLLGVLMIGIGAVWTMQGLGVGPDAILQGFMVNDIRWVFYGVLLVLVGVGEIVWVWLRPQV